MLAQERWLWETLCPLDVGSYFLFISLCGCYLLVSEFHDFHETAHAFLCLDELPLFLRDKKRALDTGHAIETRRPFRVTTKAMISKHIVDFDLPVRICFGVHKCLDESAISICLRVRLSKFRRVGSSVVSSGSGILVTKPLHQFPDRQPFWRVVEQGCDRCSCPVTRNCAPFVRSRNPCLLA